MKKNSIYALSALAAITIAGTSFTIGKFSQKNITVENNESSIHTINESTEIVDNTKENLATNDINQDQEELNTETIKNNSSDKNSTSVTKPSSANNTNNTTNTNKSEVKYTIVENKNKGTSEINFNNKTVVKDLKECLGETGYYLVFSKIGSNNLPDSEIVDWDIAFIHKLTGKVTVLEDVLYLNDPYEMESQFYSLMDNTFYGIEENGNKLYKIDLSKNTIERNIIKNSPNVSSIAGIHAKTDLLFIVDANGDILSYNDATGKFKTYTYKVKSNGNILHFSETYATDDFIKEFSFVHSHELGDTYEDGLILSVNRDQEHETGAFFIYNQNEDTFYLAED